MGVFLSRLVALFHRRRLDRDLDDELAFHLDMGEMDKGHGGATRADAHPSPRRQFGNVLRVKEQARDAWVWRWADELVWDVRYGFRQFQSHPWFSTAAITMLAVGIGVNAAVFTVTRAVLLKGSRSIDRNDRIAYIGSGGPCCPSYAEFEAWQAQATLFEGMSAVADLRITLIDTNGLVETSGATQVSADTFRLIGQRPLIGRDFTAFDEVPGAPAVAILSHSFWERQYGEDSNILGQTIRINGTDTTVIGVMPEGISFPQKQDLWVPLVRPSDVQQREARTLWFAFGRMREGVTIERIRAEIDTIGQRAADNTSQGRDSRPLVMNFHQFYFGPNATTIYGALWGAVGFVLLIVCVNVANLLLSQALGRSREMATRAALGAGRWRLVRQLLVESAMLSIVGGAFGWWLAARGVRAYELTATAPTLYWADQLLDYSLDARVLVYILATSLGTALLFGLAPALRLAKFDVYSFLRNGGSGARTRRFSTYLVAGEMALAVVLLAGAGVMVRSFLKVYTADIGATTANVHTMFMAVRGASYGRADLQLSFFDRLIPRLEAIPGVESAAIAWRPPTGGALRLPYERQGGSPDGPLGLTVSTLTIGPNYFRTLGASLLSGRDFNDADVTSGVAVAIVNEQFARMQWPGADPLGQRLRLVEGTPGPWLIVVGVSSNIVQNATRQEFDPLVYVPYRQRATDSMWILVRTGGASAGLGPALRREVQALDPNLPIWIGPFTLTERLAAGYWNRGLYGALFLVFASIAVLLAAVGLYAVIASSVSQRRQEIGIRMAIGATAQDVVRLVFHQGVVPVGSGLAVGLTLSLAVNRVLRSQLVAVSPTDPLTFVLAAAVLVFAAIVGCWIPARRATKVDPLVALRSE